MLYTTGSYSYQPGQQLIVQRDPTPENVALSLTELAVNCVSTGILNQQIQFSFRQRNLSLYSKALFGKQSLRMQRDNV